MNASTHSASGHPAGGAGPSTASEASVSHVGTNGKMRDPVCGMDVAAAVAPVAALAHAASRVELTGRFSA